MLGERVLQVWWWYLHWFRRYRKKTRGGLEIAPPVGRGLILFLTLARIRCFATFGRTGGGVGATPLGVSKRSVVELSGKDKQIALAGYSRLVVLFLVLGQYLTLWQVKGQIFGNSMIFQLYESISVKLSTVAAWDLHQRVPRSILHRMRCFDASRLNI